MRFFGLFIYLLLSFSPLSYSNILALEHLEEGDEDLSHSEDVLHIACKGAQSDCSVFYVDLIDRKVQPRLEEKMDAFSVINLSLGFQRPVPKSNPHLPPKPEERTYEESLELFKEQKAVLEEIFQKFPQSLFTIAAGNGFEIKGLYTKGVPLSSRYQVYPAYMSGSNLIKVTSINTNSLSLKFYEDYIVDDYANYSLWTVDLAAAVEKNSQGEVIRGTSFAAPYVARVASQIRDKRPNLSPQEVKEILMKSAYVKNLSRAIEVTQDYLEKGEESMAYQVHLEKSRKKRLEMLEKMNVLFVKSGGFLVPDVAQTCADLYQPLLVSIEEACLEAHQRVLGASQKRQAQLRILWKLREL